MIEAQKEVIQIQSQTSKTSSFVQFLKSSKPQIFNIFFAFVCVLLAHQIHGLRQGYKKLLGEMEEKNEEIELLRGKLREVCDVTNSIDGEGDEQPEPKSFAMSVSERCTQAVGEIFAQSDKRPGYTWILARKLASGDVMESSQVADAIRRIITDEMRSAVGDVVWTEEELKQRKVAELKADLHDIRLNASSGELSGLVEMLEQVHEEDLVGGVKKNDVGAEGTLKRTRYAI
jgi:hypothetical protein